MSRTPARVAKDAERARTDYRRSWSIVVGFGAVVIILVNWFFGTADEPRPGVAWVVATVLSAAMVAHGITSRGNQHVLPETKADGIYYQGLLFTFGSLVAALIAFGSQSAGTASTGTVIINFGIALLTTIVGLAGRVLFSMYQLGIGEISGTAVRELDEAAGEMKDKIRRAGERMEDLARHLDESTKSISETTRTVAGTVETLQSYSGAVVQTAEAIVDHVESLRTHVEGAATAAVGLREPVDEVARSIRASCDALARLDDAVSPAAAALGGLAKAGDEAEGTLRESVVATVGPARGPPHHSEFP
ncbi:MAG: DNA recombination protein RmuC [Gemmatimonadetes bacterium]|nr:DNA recombination protein RmuC [Gemmatimonadota bacterium]MYE95450.1 DNA recombination protein RmuC [Gemmatimonadota bacterium]MYJ12095.1 DNA recombination protein RmuC [Gemmatimonadota bacterium]